MKRKFLKVATATAISLSLLIPSIGVSAKVNDVIDVNVSNKSVYTVIEKSYSIDNGYKMTFKCPDGSVSILSVDGIDYRDIAIGDELKSIDKLQHSSVDISEISNSVRPPSKQFISILAVMGVVLSIFAIKTPTGETC